MSMSAKIRNIVEIGWAVFAGSVDEVAVGDDRSCVKKQLQRSLCQLIHLPNGIFLPKFNVKLKQKKSNT